MAITEILEGLRILQDGKLNFRRIGVLALCVVVLLTLRAATTGNLGSGRVLAVLENELIDQYKYEIYKKHGLYDDNAAGKRMPVEGKDFPYQDLEDLDVEFSNVSMSAPITSWSIQEDVVVRFDYQLKSGGVTKQSARQAYKNVPGTGNGTVRDSGPFLYYLHYLL